MTFDPEALRAELTTEMLARTDARFDAIEADIRAGLKNPETQPEPQPEQGEPDEPVTYDIGLVLAAYERGEITENQLAFVASEEAQRREDESKPPMSVAQLRDAADRAKPQATDELRDEVLGSLDSLEFLRSGR